MNEQGILDNLSGLLEELGVSIRAMPTGSAGSESPAGSLVRIRGREVMFLNAHAPAEEQITILVDALRGCGQLQDRYLPPEIRDLLEPSDTGAS